MKYKNLESIIGTSTSNLTLLESILLNLLEIIYSVLLLISIIYRI